MDLFNNSCVQFILPYLEFFIVHLFFLLYGMTLIVISIILFFKTRRDTLSYELIMGTVINIEKEIDNENDAVFYFPVIAFQNKSTQLEKVFRADVGSGNAKKYRVGDKVELKVCRKGEKEDIYLNSWFYIYCWPFALLCFGFVFSVVGYFAYKTS